MKTLQFFACGACPSRESKAKKIMKKAWTRYPYHGPLGYFFLSLLWVGSTFFEPETRLGPNFLSLGSAFWGTHPAKSFFFSLGSSSAWGGLLTNY